MYIIHTNEDMHRMRALKPALIDKIVDNKLTKQELNNIKLNLMKHLHTPYGTLENYPQKNIIRKIMEHYPALLDKEEIEEYGQIKINTLLSRMYEYVYDNVQVKNNPMLIKMLMNHMQGREDNANYALQQQIVINAIPNISNNGKPTLPEPKTEMIDI